MEVETHTYSDEQLQYNKNGKVHRSSLPAYICYDENGNIILELWYQYDELDVIMCYKNDITYVICYKNGEICDLRREIVKYLIKNMSNKSDLIINYNTFLNKN